MSWMTKMFGLSNDEEGYDDYDEADDLPRGNKRSVGNSGARQQREAPARSPLRFVLFKGVPSESSKLKLRDALLDGVMIMLDLSELSPRELEEKGTPFITFMTGVAFAHRGCTQTINQNMYLLTPYEGMFEEWIEEDNLNDGAFDRPGR